MKYRVYDRENGKMVAEIEADDVWWAALKARKLGIRGSKYRFAEVKEEKAEEEKSMKMQFEAGEGRHFGGEVNYIFGNGVYAEIEVPEGASEDYGYLTMKQAIMKRCPDLNAEWQYDGQEQFLAPDAAADADVYVDIEEEEEE